MGFYRIVFQLQVSLPSDQSVDINLGCDSHNTIHRYKIYVSTFLGVGTITARKRYLEALLRKNVHSVRYAMFNFSSFLLMRFRVFLFIEFLGTLTTCFYYKQKFKKNC